MMKPTLHASLLALALAAPAWADETGWANGANPQAASPVTTGPLTWTFLVDTYLGYAFNHPADHTIFPTTVAPRHNEFNLNHAMLGAEVTGLPDVQGKFVLQSGNYVDTLYGADPTLQRGAYTGILNLHNVQQAYLGTRVPILGGATWLVGIFPAYIGLESYVTQENWNYTHSVLADFTPFYLTGTTLQGNLRDDLSAQVWLVNGWQSVSKFGEGYGAGWQVAWHPGDRLVATHNFLAGAFERDQSRTRYYTDNSVQWQYARRPLPWLKRLAVAMVADLGYETAGGALPATFMGGLALYHRAEFDDRWALGLRGSLYDDPQQLLAPGLPGGVALPDGGPLASYEATATLDYRAASWLVYRLELRHDGASIPFIAGPGGVTPPSPLPAGWQPDLVTGGDRLTASAALRF